MNANSWVITFIFVNFVNFIIILMSFIVLQADNLGFKSYFNFNYDFFSFNVCFLNFNFNFNSNSNSNFGSNFNIFTLIFVINTSMADIMAFLLFLPCDLNPILMTFLDNLRKQAFFFFNVVQYDLTASFIAYLPFFLLHKAQDAHLINTDSQ